MRKIILVSTPLSRMLSLATCTGQLWGQTLTSAQISGAVSDPS
jgi:hypothetical protein